MKVRKYLFCSLAMICMALFVQVSSVKAVAANEEVHSEQKQESENKKTTKGNIEFYQKSGSSNEKTGGKLIGVLPSTGERVAVFLVIGGILLISLAGVIVFFKRYIAH